MSKNAYNKYGININNESMFINMPGNSDKDEKLPCIRAFTSSDNFLKSLYLKKGFKVNRIDEKKLIISYNNESIIFSLLSDLLVIDDGKLKEELLNRKIRTGHCHDKSIQYIGFGSYLVTGYVDDTSRNYRVIHSWIENDEYVIDYTSNLVIKKEDYYELRNVEVLSVINKEDIFSDSKSDFLKQFFSCMPIPPLAAYNR